MSDNSDYKKPRFKIFDRLPYPLQSDVSKALFGNVQDRFLTKDETKHQLGVIGQTESTQQIPEYDINGDIDVQRQAWQLQPMVYHKVATVDHALTFRDLLTRLGQLGVASNRFHKWGKTEQFNWVPPVDLDKLINYSSYMWFDPADPTSKPEYVTIKNKCSEAEVKVAAKLLEIGGVVEHTITALTSSTVTFPGAFSLYFTTGLQFDIINSTNNDGTYTVVTATAVGSDTVVEVAETLNTAVVDGSVSLQSIMEPFYAERDCACYGTTGWGGSLWDDNNIGNGDWTSDWITSISGVVAPTITVSVTAPLLPVDGQLWHDTNINEVKQYIAASTEWSTLVPYWYDTNTNEFKRYNVNTFSWDVVPNQQALEDAIAQSSGASVWDAEATCQVQADDWWQGNKWLHQDDVPNLSIAQRATMPILEFMPDLELNRWTYTKHKWMRRIDPTSLLPEEYEWLEVDVEPTLAEILAPDFQEHWLWLGEDYTAPINDQVDNTPILLDIFVATPGQTIFDFFTAGLDQIALAGQDQIRVYHNGRRLYTEYTERTLAVSKNIVVGGVVTPTFYDYVKGIELNVGADEFDVITVEVNAAALSDAGLESVEVRITETDIGAPNYNANDTEIVSLIHYRKAEQVKYQHTQYPLFNLYNADLDFVGVSELFRFVEDSSYPAEDRLDGLRIVVTDLGTNWQFEQLLVDETTGEMFAYKDLSKLDPYQTIWREGDGDAEYYVPHHITEERVEAFTSTIAPSSPEEGDLWYNPEANGGAGELKEWDGSTWTISTTRTDWEIPHQLYFNASHENRKQLSFTDLYTHLSSIIDAQEDEWRLVAAPNYGLGGTIKEHNDSFDTTLSAMFVQTGEPLQIVEFAQNRYETNLNAIVATAKQNMVSYMTNITPNYIHDFTQPLADMAIETFEQNDVNQITFGDSTTYNPATGDGIRGWIATLPFLRLAFKKVPVALYDDTLGLTQVLCHDGHLQNVELETVFKTKVLSEVFATPHPFPTVLGETWGTIQATTPPTSWNTYYTTYNGKAGKYWKDSSSGKYYRFKAISAGIGQPSTLYPVGSLWYDTATDLLKENDGIAYNAIAGVDDITLAWEEIILEESIADVILEVENRLYAAAPTITELAFDITPYIVDSYDIANYELYSQEAFEDYIQARQIEDEFASVYVAGDAFTWNYKNVDVNDVSYPTANTILNQPWGSTWQSIYLAVYKTPYPHLEPWKLQGYTSKTTWWDSYYKDITGTRRWNALMWSNMTAGIVPVGELLPDGITLSTGVAGEVEAYTHFSVDTLTDELLPPYVNGSTDTLLSVIGDIPNPDDDYLFADIGPVEWEWRVSSQALYDAQKIAFRLEPIRWMHFTFGNTYDYVNTLNIDHRTHKVYSHLDAVFHGDIVNNQLFQVAGTNQWYTHFNRYNSYDNKLSDFRELWTEWTPTLTYQFGSFIDTKSFDVQARLVDITEADYTILVKKSPGIANFWLDSLVVTATKFSRSRISGDSADDWEFTISSPAPVGRTISYYDVNTAGQSTTFYALEAATTSQKWYHYPVDKNTTYDITLPAKFTGMQTLVNFIDGYKAKLEDAGFVFNDPEVTEIDLNYGRSVSWQLETERMIDYMYKARNSKYSAEIPVVLPPTIEVNPFRNNIWIKHDQGLLANVVQGPYTNIRTDQTVFDQYGRLVPSNDLHVYREDKRSRITMQEEVENDVVANTSSYNYIHFGGMHLFLDGYEHVVVFNDYTITNDAIIYDAFLGLDIQRLLTEFYKHESTTLRPNIGGFYLYNNELRRNFEGSIEDEQLYYDTNVVRESAAFMDRARALLGYEKQDYFDHVGMNSKSQFLFWKGMVQNKGSVKSVKAFINSRRFEDASVDEYWMYKVADFGDVARQQYPEIKLLIDDINRDRLKLHFGTPTDYPTSDFVNITFDDDNRWFRRPDEQLKLVDAGVNTNLFFDAIPSAVYNNPTPVTGDRFKVAICDDIRVTFFQGDAKYTNNTFSGSVATLSFNFAVDSDNIAVFLDGVLQKGTYTETAVNEITFNAPVVGPSVLVVIRKPGLLSASRVIKHNAEVFSVVDFASLVDFTIYPINPAKTKLGPSKLIDYKSNVVLTDIPIWDPARGHYAPYAVHNIDFWMTTDPANYTDSFNSLLNDANHRWDSNEVGKVWLDSSAVGYLPYYDDKRYLLIDQRINSWGKLADWADIKTYEWVESDTTPDSWSGDGTPKTSLFYRERAAEEYTLTAQTIATTNVDINLDLNALPQLRLKKNDKTELTFSTYNVRVEINSNTIAYDLRIDGIRAQTYGQLVDEINADLPDTIEAVLGTTGIDFISKDRTVRDIDVIADPSDEYDVWYGLSHDSYPVFGKRFAIISADTVLDTLTVIGDVTSDFPAATVFDVVGSTGNDNTYTVVSSIVDGNGNTVISVAAVASAIADGFVLLQAGTVTQVTTTVESMISIPVDPNECTVGFTLEEKAVIVKPFNIDLPAQLSDGSTYYIVENTPYFPGQYFLSTTVGGEPINVDAQLDYIQVVDINNWTTWSEMKRIDLEFHIPLYTVNPTYGVRVDIDPITSEVTGIEICQTVSIYVNGKFKEEVETVAFGGGIWAPISAGTQADIRPADVIHVTKFVDSPTDEELSFDPDVEDDGTYLTQYKEDYQYTTIEKEGVTGGLSSVKYYFWVENKSLPADSKTLSLNEIESQLIQIPTPYMFYQRLLRTVKTSGSNGSTVILPDRYNQAIARGLSNIVVDDDRYKLRFIQDFALRDNINDGRTPLDNKNKHTEWRLFRRQQHTKIPAYLWDKMVDALVGETVNPDSSISPVPSLDRQLYDSIYGTDTQYGLGVGQAFVNKELGLSTVVTLLLDPDYDTAPFTKEQFFATFSLDTKVNIRATMDYIYAAFSVESVNDLFFEVMFDALTLKSEFAGLQKTSYIALEGVRVLNTTGIEYDF